MKQGIFAERRVLAVGLALFFFFLALLPQSVSAEEEPEIDLAAALVSSASYSSDGGLLVRSWLKETDWDFQNRSTSTRAAQGRVYLARKTLADGRRFVVLSFPGTERRKDIEIDLRLSDVPFGGASPAEFADVAGKIGDKDLPRVHRGFNDFVTAALFTETMPEFDGLTAGESLAEELKENPSEVLYLTGHSLGGAAALLTAARLSDLGVSRDQLQVVTFGAPAVGDEKFARLYETKIHLKRIVMKADPVAAILQSVTKRFVQFGERVDWKPRTREERFNHEMALYLDEALRRSLRAVSMSQLLPSICRKLWHRMRRTSNAPCTMRSMCVMRRRSFPRKAGRRNRFLPPHAPPAASTSSSIIFRAACCAKGVAVSA